ncbi:unnamed protein product [Brassica rapa subsp. trilocularis]
MDFNATVAEGITNGNWWIHTSRSRNPVLSLLHNCLPPVMMLQLHLSELHSLGHQRAIPKHAFRTWLIILNRLPTRDRLREWGLD